jgi:CRP/FNR family nitrogen fixation transcriptional regulator
VATQTNVGIADGQSDDRSVSEAIGQLGVRISVSKDEEMYGQGEDVDFVYLILGGAVRTTHHMSDGRRQIGDFYRTGDMLGFETRPQHWFSAEALQQCLILALRRSALTGTDGALQRLISMSVDREFERAQEHLLQLGCKTAEEKVAGFLLDCVRDAPGEFIDLPMSRRDIADYLCLSVETVSRMLSQLRTSRIVTFSTKRLVRVVNLKALAHLAEAPFPLQSARALIVARPALSGRPRSPSLVAAPVLA